MQIFVYDTRVRTLQGDCLHFDVLIDSKREEDANHYALQWLADQGIDTTQVQQSICQFCHARPADHSVLEHIAAHGYFVIDLTQR